MNIAKHILLLALVLATQIQAAWDDSLDFTAVFLKEQTYKGRSRFFYVRKGSSEFIKWLDSDDYDKGVSINDTLVIYPNYYTEYFAKKGFEAKRKNIAIGDSSVADSLRFDFFYNDIIAVKSGFLVRNDHGHLRSNRKIDLYDFDWKFKKTIFRISDSIDVLRLLDGAGEVIARFPLSAGYKLAETSFGVIDYDDSRGWILCGIDNPYYPAINSIVLIRMNEGIMHIVNPRSRRYILGHARIHKDMILLTRYNPTCECIEILLHNPLTGTEKILVQEGTGITPFIQGNLLIYGYKFDAEIIVLDLTTGEKHRISFAPRWWERLLFINWVSVKLWDIEPNIRHGREE